LVYDLAEGFLEGPTREELLSLDVALRQEELVEGEMGRLEVPATGKCFSAMLSTIREQFLNG
jgi:hypothetical protein